MDDFIFEEIAINSRGRNFAAAIKMKEKLYGSSAMEVYDSEAFGRCLYLDGSLQLCEKYEHIYHEAMVHPCLSRIEGLAKVLIIGGGDGGTLREVLKYPNLKKVIMVEILPEIVDVSKKHLPFTNLEESLNNPIVQLIYADGARFIKDSTEFYDAIIIDCSDPKGNSEVLYGREFLTDCVSRLSIRGGLAIQATNAIVREEFVKELKYILNRLLPNVDYMYVPVPSYVTGGIGFLFATDNTNLKRTLPAGLKFITDKTINAGIATCYDIVHKNKLEDTFNWYCEKVYDWKKILSTAELEYIYSSFEFECEPLNEEDQVKHMEFGHSVMKSGVSNESLTVMTNEHDVTMQMLVRDIMKSRNVITPHGLKVKGLRFNTMFRMCDFIFILTQEELKQFYPEAYGAKPDRCYDKVRMYHMYSKTRFVGTSFVFSDMSRRYYRSIMDYDAELIRVDASHVRPKVNSYGKVLIDSFGRQGVKPYEYIGKDPHCYELSFAL